MNFIWVLLAALAAGGVGGFVANVVPQGAGKTQLDAAPAEAGAFASTLAGALAGAASLLLTEPLQQIVLFGKDHDAGLASLSVDQLVRCFGVGLIGIKWLLSYQGFQALRSAVVEAATKEGTNHRAAALAASARPRQVLAATRQR
jgi:hypothetical protein